MKPYYETENKIKYTQELIHQWVDYWGKDNVYVAFSGGKDSTVLTHIIKQLYPNIPLVFSNTGLEFPEIVQFVRSFENIIELRPKMPFHKVIKKYGWPVISKNVSMAISRYRNTKSPDQKEYRLHGKIVNGKKLTAGTIPKKWRFMIDAPFKISDQCCQYLKKNPFKTFEKETGKKPFIGIMESDSNSRKLTIQKNGCNVYDSKSPQSRPLSKWNESDIYKYITMEHVPICNIYNYGYDRTGCMFCMYGLLQEEKNTGNNRFMKLKKTHLKQYDYIINKLGASEVLDFMEIEY